MQYILNNFYAMDVNKKYFLVKFHEIISLKLTNVPYMNEKLFEIFDGGFKNSVGFCYRSRENDICETKTIFIFV